MIDHLGNFVNNTLPTLREAVDVYGDRTEWLVEFDIVAFNGLHLNAGQQIEIPLTLVIRGI